MKEKVFKFVDMVFVSIKLSSHLLIFPGYKSLHMLIFSAAIFLVSGVAALLRKFGDMPFFINLIDWRGALLSTVILFILYIIQIRKEDTDDD